MDIFTGRTAVVTGGAGGIGAAVAETFAQFGCKAVVIGDVSKEQGDLKAAEISAKYTCETVFCRLDVTDEASVADLFRMVKEKFGGVDYLVNCAGICPTQSIPDTTTAGWDRTMNINLRGTFLCCKEAFAQMTESNFGRIVNTTSISARIGGIGTGMDYVASKGGILSMTMGLAKKGAPYNINVNSVAPGFINTNMTKDLKHFDPKSVPLGRIGEPSDVADVVKFLCSNDSRYVTGICIDVNGGVFMCS